MQHVNNVKFVIEARARFLEVIDGIASIEAIVQYSGKMHILCTYDRSVEFGWMTKQSMCIFGYSDNSMKKLII